MKIFVRTKPNAREEKLEKIDNIHFLVSVKASPQEGRANAAVVRAIAGYFQVSQAQITIVSGRTAKNKVIEIK